MTAVAESKLRAAGNTFRQPGDNGMNEITKHTTNEESKMVGRLVLDVCFAFNRYGDSLRATVWIDEAVPVSDRKKCVGDYLRANGHPEAHDVVFLKEPPKWTAVETGFSADYEGVASGF